jgi:hypothetical protein
MDPPKSEFRPISGEEGVMLHFKQRNVKYPNETLVNMTAYQSILTLPLKLPFL